MQKKNIKILAITFIKSFFIIQNSLAAELQYKMLTEGGFDSGNSNGIFIIQDVNIQNFFNYGFNIVVGGSIAMAVVLLSFAGVSKILETFGVKSVSPLGKDYKPDFFNPIMGLIIILSSVLILRTLNPDLLTLPIFDNMNFANQTKQTSDSIKIE
jgi:hypothetical protein